MSAAQDHPKSLPGVPYIFPDWLDRLQARFETPVIRRFHRFPTFAIVEHRGRKSGRRYETVVRAYCRGSVLAVLLGHGKADWVKNIVAAGEADARMFRRDLHIVNPRVVPVGGDTSELHWIARLGAHRVGVFVADIGAPGA
ncbi:MAG: nitroreductase family deazaflavin-dependent oxidoreductase [Mycobacterium sp.]